MPICKNCQSALDGNYCASCGQQDIDLNRSIWDLIGSLIRETFEIDGRSASTINVLFHRPGKLTAEFLAGRRAAYTPPLRLYLIFSIVFFILVAWFASSGILREPGADPVFDAALQVRFLSDDLPTLMFLLLPVFALLVKSVFWRRLYIDHLVFSLHVHCAAYVALAVILPLEVVATRHVGLMIVQVLVFASFLAYFIIAVRRVYRATWLSTVIRSMLILLAYTIIVSIAIESSSEFAIITD